MLIPYGTDTPIYHWPIATGVMVLLNIICFPIFDSSFYYLTLGGGIYPLEWITNIFAHAGLGHLIGNMIFLLIFGAIVEGKTGSFPFVGIYFAIGLLESGSQQILLMNSSPGEALGASGVIYGLMMCAMLFAPKDNLLCVFFLFILLPPVFLQIPILIFALVYFLLDFTVIFWNGFGVSSALFHCIGGLVGVAAGTTLLKTHWVDCDNEDLLSMFRELGGKEPIERPLSKRELKEREEQKARLAEERRQRIEVGWRSINAHFAAGNYSAAVAVYNQLHRNFPEQRWNETQLLTVIKHFMEQKDWAAVTEHSIDYLNRFQSKAATVSITLAKIQLLEFERPSKAIEIIRRIDAPVITEQQRRVCQQIVNKAQKMLDEGTLELSDE